MTRSATSSSMARARAAPMNAVLISTPVPVSRWSRAQVHSISPDPQARSSTLVPGDRYSARPKGGQLFAGERVMTAVAALPDHKSLGKIIHPGRSFDAGVATGLNLTGRLYAVHPY